MNVSDVSSVHGYCKNRMNAARDSMHTEKRRPSRPPSSQTSTRSYQLRSRARALPPAASGGTDAPPMQAQTQRHSRERRYRLIQHVP